MLLAWLCLYSKVVRGIGVWIDLCLDLFWQRKYLTFREIKTRYHRSLHQTGALDLSIYNQVQI